MWTGWERKLKTAGNLLFPALGRWLGEVMMRLFLTHRYSQHIWHPFIKHPLTADSLHNMTDLRAIFVIKKIKQSQYKITMVVNCHFQLPYCISVKCFCLISATFWVGLCNLSTWRNADFSRANSCICFCFSFLCMHLGWGLGLPLLFQKLNIFREPFFCWPNLSVQFICRNINFRDL